jgi:hypothetical protein
LTGAAGKVALFGGDLVISGTTNAKGALTASSGIYVTGDVLDVSGSFILTGSAYVTGFISASVLTGSLTKLSDGTSYLVAGNNISITSQSNGSILITASAALTSPGGSNTQVQFNDNGLFSGSSLFTFDKNTGAVTASYFVGNGGGLTYLTASLVYVSGAATIDGYLQLLPVGPVVIPTNQTAGYMYVSGSTNDIYFTQYQPGSGFNNTTRLRWLEGTLTTGLLHGGVLSTQNGTTTFSITSGSGLIVTYNASTTSDPYPTIKFVNWPATVSQSLGYVTSSFITYIGINSSGGIIQQTSPFTLAADSEFITIGRVLHQSGSVTNGTITSPIVAYGTNHWQDDFTRAFGPLKVSGHILAASGSTLGLTKTAGDSYAIGRNYTTNPNNPNNVTSVTDTAVTVSKIFREYVSGSTVNLDTGVANAGYTGIDPTKYNNNGTLSAVGGGSYTIQRVYWFPNSANRAFTVYYGQRTYATLDDAQQSIASEIFTEGDNTAGAAILVGYILVKGNASDLSNSTQARILQAGISRGAGAGGGGGVAVGATTPGGLDTYVQFNDGGSTFGGDSGLTYNKTTDVLTVGNISLGDTGIVSTTGTSISLFNSTATTVNFAGAATALNMGVSTGVTAISGAVRMPQGLSGSLTKLVDGTSYMIAGSGITISSASNGAVTVTANNIPTSSITSFPFNDGGNKLATTSSIAFSNGGGWSYFANNAGSDVYFFVSGSIGTGTDTNRKLAVFKSDVVMSGSVTQGSGSFANGAASHAEGQDSITTIDGTAAHAEGRNTKAAAYGSHTEGYFTTSSLGSNYSHAEGYLTLANNTYAHAEGQSTTAGGTYSHAEGDHCITSAAAAHAEGYYSNANGNYSHAEGNQTTAVGQYSHAEGYLTKTSSTALGSHAEGYLTVTTGSYSHAEGESTTTYGIGSHAEGKSTIASGSYSHVEGLGTIASGSYQTIIGQYNKRGNLTSLFVIGNGTADADANRSDVFRVNSSTVEVTGSLLVSGSATFGSLISSGTLISTGSLAIVSGNVTFPYTAKTTTYNIGSSDYVIDCNGTFTVTLPSAVNDAGKIHVVKNSGTGTITVATTSSQTIDGSLTLTIATQYAAYTLMSNGSNWIII